jgi:hypothetical protein
MGSLYHGSMANRKAKTDQFLLDMRVSRRRRPALQPLMLSDQRSARRVLRLRLSHVESSSKLFHLSSVTRNS